MIEFSRCKSIRHIKKLVLAVPLASLGFVGAKAAQPTWVTPAAVPQSTNVLYVIPYAVSTQPSATVPPTLPDGETVITIGGKLLASSACVIQVEWVDWVGTIVGYSQPVGAPAIAGNDTLEFTTQAAPVTPLTPFILNVFSNLTAPFEGHANVRSNCAATSKLRVDAEFVTVPPSGSGLPTLYKPIKVVRAAGNAGD